MSSRFALKPADYPGSPMAKQAFNHALFTEVAPKYDFITRGLSLGRDGAWKRRLIGRLPEAGAPRCLDLACGTGDLTRMLAARYPGGEIIGLDLSPAMLDIARKHPGPGHASYVEASMHELPQVDASVDIVTGSYALRNALDLDQALDEVARVLRPGGAAAFLDFSKPPSRFGQRLGHALLKGWGGFWGLALHGNPDVYGYIADSLRLYPDREDLRARLIRRGLVPVSTDRFYFGLLECLVVEKTG